MVKIVLFICFITIFNSVNFIKSEELHVRSSQYPSTLEHFSILGDNFNSNLGVGDSQSSNSRIRNKRDEPTKKPDLELFLPNGAGSNTSGEASKANPSQLLGQQQMVGVNGTGQRKNYTTQQPILADTITTVAKSGMLGGSLGAFGSVSGEMAAEDLPWENFDQPEEDTNSTLLSHNITNYQQDHHIYYNSSILVNAGEATKHRNTIKNLTISNLLSKSHRRAMTIQLSFDFPFYGHPVRNVTVATGGFLYTGDHVHSWLAATQYIAPLMANFDTSLSNDSYVKYSDNGTAFTVLWENVRLQDKEVGLFTFSATLYKTGDIVFAYYSVPIKIQSIQDDKHPVKVGLSDAYIIDKTIFFARRKTIYEYHRVSFGSDQIQNNTLIYLQAQTTCLDFTDCQSCVEAQVNSLKCRWCPSLNRCSTGTDRRRQEWMQSGCDNGKIEDAAQCPAKGEKGNNYQPSSPPTDIESDVNKYNTNTNGNSNNNGKDGSNESVVSPSQGSSRINDRKMSLPESANDLNKAEHKASEEEHHAESGVNTFLSFFIPIGLIFTIICWVFYAYRNPHTKSGQLLIQYRPSQWSWRRGEARYTAATIHM